MTKCWLIAEGGSNHARDLDLALSLTEEAARAGADAIKWQLFKADDLYARGTAQWQAALGAELPPEWVPPLAARASGCGIDFLCSAFAPWAVDVVDPYVVAHKVASLEMVQTDLVRYVASKRKPIILSTGAADIVEVMVVRRIIEDSWWGAKVCVMQCGASYPCPDDEVDLLAGPTLGSTWGYSDHTLDISAAVGAAWLGASVIEKHIRPAGLPPDPKPPDWDHSIDPDQFKEMVHRIRLAEKQRGIPRKYVRDSEKALRRWQHAPGGLRGGLHAA